MNKNELGRMLDMVDEKFIAEMLDTSVRVQPVKRQRFILPAVSAAVICLAVGLLLKGSGDISVDEGQGVTGDSEIISTDIIPGENTEVTAVTSYDGLFEYPLDIGRYSRTMEVWDRQYIYGIGHTGALLGEGISFPGSEEFESAAFSMYDRDGRFLSANVLSVISDTGITYEISVSDCGDMNYAYGEPCERYGEAVYSFYCEKVNGLELWSYFEHEGRQYLVYSCGLERDEAGAVLDCLLTGKVDLDILTPENASGMNCTVPANEAAGLPGFDWIYTGPLGGVFLRENTGVYSVQYDGRGNIDGVSLSVVYNAYGEEFAVTYETGTSANLPPYPIPPDISDISPEELDELCSLNERTVTAGDNVITVSGDCPREALEILFDNIKCK